ncbi:MAG: peptidase U34 [Actinomycetota bacterium]|nr:peptidase U34 [Actinomycetota bacterium]
MCDTLVAITGAGILFGKNSDREPNESQLVEWHPAASHQPEARLRCTWIEIPQVAHTNAVVVSRPWWMWGAEIGANEHGVVIGNEAVFTDQPYGEPALLGMDLLRLALERAATAADAVSVMVDLLEAHGQGGACSHDRPRFTYHNSFLVADPDGAVVLETAGRHWATEDVAGPGRSISNGLTIPAFAAAHARNLRSRVASAPARRARTTAAACAAQEPADVMAALRDHGGGTAPRYSRWNGALAGPCAHAGGLLVSTQTTASWVADLRGVPLHWATGTSAPCTSLFKPVRVDEPVPDGPSPSDRFDPSSRWWRHERLHRAVLADHDALMARFAPERDRCEAAWLADPPPSATAFAEGDRLEAAWLAEVTGAATGTADRRPAWLRRHWRRLDAAAGLGPQRA